MHQVLKQFSGVLIVVRASWEKIMKMKTAESMHQALNQFSGVLNVVRASRGKN